MKGDIDLANYTITAAWLDGETIRYRLNNNSIWAAYTGRNIENVSNTATTISFAQGEFIKVMSLNPVSGSVSSARTIGQRKIQRQQPETSSFEQQYDKRRASTENNYENNSRNDHASGDGEGGLAANIGGWLGRRWGIALRHFLHKGWNIDFDDMFFLLLPFIPFIILYYLISGIYGTAVNAVDSAADIFSSDNDKPVQTSVVTESSRNGSDAQTSAVAESAVKNNNFQETTYAEQGRIKGSNVNMREYPNLEGRVIYRFPGQEDVIIHEVTKPDQGKYPWFKVSYKNLTGWVYGQFVINQSDVKKVPKETVTAENQANISTQSEIAPQKAENKIQLTGEKVMVPHRIDRVPEITVDFFGDERPADKRYGKYAYIYPGEYVYTTNTTKEPDFHLVKHDALGFVWMARDINKWKSTVSDTYGTTPTLPDVEIYQEKKWLNKSGLGCTLVWRDPKRNAVSVSSSIAVGDYVLLTSKKYIVWHDRLGLVKIGQYPWEELAGIKVYSGEYSDTD